MIFAKRKRPMKDNSDLPYDVRYVHMNTCARLYQKWRQSRLRYRKAPIEGIPVKVEYVDVLPSALSLTFPPSSRPITALCLHGAPGTHRDFRHLIAHLTARNIRVVAPNFPDYGLTKQTPLFVHSAEEKAEYIKDFLEAIKLNHIDLLICHSSSIFPAVILITEWLNAVKQGVAVGSNASAPVASFGSLVLVNPCTQRPFRQLRPLIRQGVFRPSALLYQLRPSRMFIRFCGRFVLDVFGSPVDYHNFDNVMLTLTTILNCGHKRMAPRMLQIMEHQLPLLMIYSEKDRLIPKDHFHSFAKLLGIEQIDFDDSEATHRSNSNQSSQSSFDQNELEINNNETSIELQQLTLSEKNDIDSIDSHSIHLNQTSKAKFDFESDTSSALTDSDSDKLDLIDKDEDEPDVISSSESSECDLTGQAQEMHHDTLHLNGPKRAVCIAKAGHYSLISHSHVIAQQIDQLLVSYDLRSSK